MKMASKFFYFAYGSNLLARRIHINNPSAVRAGIGKIENYELDFITYSTRWRGASATIAKRPGKHVWGAIWEMDLKDLESLDRQEGVEANIYFRFMVKVVLPGGASKDCWVYEQCNKPPSTSIVEQLPEDRKPSAVYIATMVKGAEESGLPEDYQNFLKRIPNNGYRGEVDVGIALNVIE